MGALGIYFGPKIIRIVETKGRRVINNAQILQSTISTGELEEKVPVEVKTIEIVALFKDELRRNKIEAKEATLCLSGRDLIIRTFEIPMIPREEIDGAINFEAKKYIPFKVEDLIADFQIRFDRSSRTNLVLFIGIKRETLDRYVSILSQLGIKINSIEYSAFSVLRCLRLSNASDNGIIGFLEADLEGEDEVNFTVLENGFPLFSRDISLIGGPESLGRAKELEPAGVLEKLKTELHVSLDYYNRKFPTKNIKKVFLICHQDNRTDLEVFIREIGLSVQFINITKYLDKAAAYSLSLIKGYCASLYRDIKTNLKVNLLSVREKLKSLKEKAGPRETVSMLEGFRLDFRIIALGLLICASAYGYGFYQMRPLHEELESIIAKRVQVSTINPSATYDELTSKDLEYKKKLESLDDLIKKQMYLTEVLNALPSDLPTGAWLTNFSFSKMSDGKAELRLEGMVYLSDSDKEFKAINKFLENLKGDPRFTKYFKDASITSIDRKQFGSAASIIGTNFYVSCKTYQERE